MPCDGAAAALPSLCSQDGQGCNEIPAQTEHAQKMQAQSSKGGALWGHEGRGCAACLCSGGCCGKASACARQPAGRAIRRDRAGTPVLPQCSTHSRAQMPVPAWSQADQQRRRRSARGRCKHGNGGVWVHMCACVRTRTHAHTCTRTHVTRQWCDNAAAAVERMRSDRFSTTPSPGMLEGIDTGLALQPTVPSSKMPAPLNLPAPRAGGRGTQSAGWA